jgi:heat shock protein HslJ
MAPSHALASIVLALALLAMPWDALAQSPSATPGALPTAAPEWPLALEPAGLPPLEGSTWRLVTFRGREMRPVGPEVAAWMTLRTGQVRGSTGCNRLTGRYGRVGQALAFELVDRRQGACAARVALVASSLTDALERAASFEVVLASDEIGAQLIVRDADGHEDLRFELDGSGALPAGDWRLQSYTSAGRTVAADPAQPAVLAFRPIRSRDLQRRSSGDIVASTGCNGIVGTYLRRADVLSLGPLERTDAPCAPTLAAQEAAIMAVLESPSLALDLSLDGLTLASPDTDDRLEFLSAAPLEGTTWLLAAVPGSRGSEDTVTLQLQGGTLHGEGPCGPFAGHYVSEGVFLTLDDISAADVTGCTRKAEHRALLDALRAAVMVERGDPGLRLLGARGQLVAAFSPAGAL